MSSSTPFPKEFRFLLDENVRIELDEWLVSRKINFIRLPPAISDSVIAAASKKEKRIVVTNDRGFTLFAKDRIFSVVWLRIPQRDITTLIAQFEKLLAECQTFTTRLIVLNPDGWRSEPLSRWLKSRRTKYG